MRDATIPEEIDELIPRLGELADSHAIQKFFEENPSLRKAELIGRLAEEATRLAREDFHRAERMVEAAAWLAAAVDDDYGRGRASRAAGHLLYLTGKYHPALERYQAALGIFESLGNEIEAAITLSSALQPMAYLSKYSEAFAQADKAREIFERHSDGLRLARLETHVGNILYRQDRFEEAMQIYHRAEAAFGPNTDAQNIAPLLLNMAVCYTGLNEFSKALEAYERLQEVCRSHSMPLLAAQADYNIAYLYYLRGEHIRAIELYQLTRERCHEAGDSYHQALCDLDQSDLYLELNLIAEGVQQAHLAFCAFEALGMGYEAAKAQKNLGLASFRRGRNAEALELLEDARKRFEREDNWVWTALIDLYMALILHEQERSEEARKKCEAAREFFSKNSLPAKTAVCELLLARLELTADKGREALQACCRAQQLAEQDGSPALRAQVHLLLGQVHEALGSRNEAFHAYGEAKTVLGEMGSNVRGEELKIETGSDRVAVYENLVWLSLKGERKAEHQEATFQYIEQSKSRRMANLIAFRINSLPVKSSPNGSLVEQVRDLRGELNWGYRQLNIHQMKADSSSAANAEALRERVREQEAQLLKALAELRKTDAEFTSLQEAASAPLLAIRSNLPADTVLLEYFLARGTFVSCCVTKRALEIVPLAPAQRIHELLRDWHRCLASVRQDESMDTAKEILSELYRSLILPLREQLIGSNLVICPDRFLYQVPFQALFDGQRFLIDQYTVSYAPSASVFHLCRTKARSFNEQSVIFGASCSRRPAILEEISAVASVLPRAQILLGAQANETNLHDQGPISRFVHLASEGSFRQDNPMFSTIRIGDSEMPLFELYRRFLPCELVAITGCGESLQSSESEEGLLSLVRGLLYAGAETALITLWDAPENISGAFLKSFYERLLKNSNRALCMQQTMHEFRNTHPHPYHWAPFVLFGECRLS
ncbi:MAG: CHAT domain-containing protein [Candidatus Acidiferrales bacterium]